MAKATKKPPKTYRYDSSLSPALDWDGGNGARKIGEWLLSMIERGAALDPPHAFGAPEEFRSADGRVVAIVRGLRDAVDQLKRLSRPFLAWAERRSGCNSYPNVRKETISPVKNLDNKRDKNPPKKHGKSPL